MHGTSRWKCASTLVATTVTVLTTMSLGPGPARAQGGCTPVGGSELFATMPVAMPFFPPTGPTYPEGVTVLDGRVVTSGPANFGTAGNGSPSQLTIFDQASGAVRAEVPLVGEDLTQEHALSELFAWGKYVPRHYVPRPQGVRSPPRLALS